MTDVLLQLVWVAAHHGLRKQGRAFKSARWPQSAADSMLSIGWRHVQKLASALGHPPAPGGPL